MAEKYNICLDIGGTKILGVIFDSNQKIIYRLKKKTRSGGDAAENIEEVIIGIVDEMIRESGIKKKQILSGSVADPCVPRSRRPSVLLPENFHSFER